MKPSLKQAEGHCLAHYCHGAKKQNIGVCENLSRATVWEVLCMCQIRMVINVHKATTLLKWSNSGNPGRIKGDHLWTNFQCSLSPDVLPCHTRACQCLFRGTVMSIKTSTKTNISFSIFYFPQKIPFSDLTSVLEVTSYLCVSVHICVVALIHVRAHICFRVHNNVRANIHFRANIHVRAHIHIKAHICVRAHMDRYYFCNNLVCCDNIIRNHTVAWELEYKLLIDGRSILWMFYPQLVLLMNSLHWDTLIGLFHFQP